MFSFLLCKYVGVQLLSHNVRVCLTSLELLNLLTSGLYQFTFQPAVWEGFDCSPT